MGIADGDPSLFPETFPIPADNTERSAASVNVAFEALADRTAYARRRLGNVFQWGYFPAAPAWTFIEFSDQTFETPGSGGYVDCPLMPLGAYLMIDMATILENAGTGPSGFGGRVRLVAIDDKDGPNEAALAPIPCGETFTTAPTGQYLPVSLHCAHKVLVAGKTRIMIQGRSETAGQSVRVQRTLSIRVLAFVPVAEGVTIDES